jgi:outer membrane protein assembly factor BamB
MKNHQTAYTYSVAPIAALYLLMQSAAGSDWPQWQGPNRDAVSTEKGLLQEWPEDGPPLAWKATGLGGGYCAPAVAGGRLYGISSQGEDEVIWARSEKDGSEIWTKRLDAKTADGMRQGIEGAGCTPTVDGDRLYVIGYGGTLACMRTEDGEIVWQRSLISDLGGRLPTWRYNESPLIDGDKIICTPGGESSTLVALNKMNGEVIWESLVPEQGLTAPSPSEEASAGGDRSVAPPPGRRPAPAPAEAPIPATTETTTATTPDAKPATLVAAGSQWKYFDKGSPPSADWASAGFDDSAWSEGKAQLGYGDRDEATLISAAADGYPTYYFRHSFEVDDPAQLKPLVLRLLRDDGAIIHVNGKEIVRDNMPTGDVAHGTLAAGVTPSESGFYVHDLAASVITKGKNILAVEVHQASADSSDVSFDLELREKIPGKDVAGAPQDDRRRPGGGRGFGGGGRGAARTGAGYSSAIAIDFGGQRQYLQFTARSLVGVSAADGKLLWRYDRPANRMGINCSTPLYLGGGKVFAASAYGSGGGLAQLKKNDTGGIDAEEIWFSGDMENHHGGVVVIDGCLYGANGGNGGGNLICLDLESGEVLWDERDSNDSIAEKGSVAFADGRLYYRTEDGTVLLVEPSRDEFVERGRVEQPERTSQPAWTHPVIANGMLYIRDQDLLLCYDIKAGEKK